MISPLAEKVVSTDQSNLLTSSISSALCADPTYASIFKINENGSINVNQPLDSVLVGLDGRYNFDLNKFVHTTSVDYIVRAVGCDGKIYQRPITDFNTKQDIDARTTVIAYVINADTEKKLNEASRKDIQELIDSLNDESIDLALDSVLTNENNSNKFLQIFATSPNALKEARAEVTLNYPSSFLNELSPANFSLTTFHIYSGYPFIYKWEFYGSNVSGNKNWNYIPSANESGDHQVNIYVGKNDDTGNVDLTKPYYKETIAINVNNNILPVAPPVTINAATLGPRKVNSILVNINTGVDFKNCMSFSKMAFTESALPPDEDKFDILCTTQGTQTESVSYSAGDGIKKLYLWAMDKEGVISSASLVPDFVLDTQPPNLSFSFPKTHVKGGEDYNLTISASDAGAGLLSLDLYFSEDDGSSYTIYSNLGINGGPYVWSAPVKNTVNARIKLVATDLLGFSKSVETNIFSIDSTKPAAMPFTLATPALSSSKVVSVTMTTCTAEVDQILLTDSIFPLPLPLTGLETGWKTCSTAAAGHSLTINGEGAHTIYAWSKDKAGNISASATSVSMTLDTLAPTIVTGPIIASPIKGGSTKNITWSVTDTNTVLIKLEYYNETDWIEIVSSATNNGTYSWTAPVVDSDKYKIKLTAIDQVLNKSVKESDTFIIDITAPVVSQTIINDGALYAGTPLVSLKVTVADNYSVGNQISLRFSTAHVTTEDCQSEYSDTNWNIYNNPTTAILYSIVPFDGMKKICVWAKDAVGNISVINTPTTGVTGVTYDKIEYQTGKPPSIDSLIVTRTSDGSYKANNEDPMTISWSVSDFEELAKNPISFSYTTDNKVWKDIYTKQNITDRNQITWYGVVAPGEKTKSGVVTSWTAPSSTYFRLKAQGLDVAGNTSSFIMSQPFNSGNWTVYAGNKDRGDGGTGKTALLYGDQKFSSFAINPTNGDIYAYDKNLGIRKLDAKTGMVSTFIKNGGGFPADGPLPAAMDIAPHVNPIFDKKGRLYLSIYHTNYAVIVYQVDIENSSIRKYAGGGTNDDGGSLSTELRVGSSGMSFDEQNSLYLFTLTSNPVFGDSFYLNTGKRLLKVIQNNDGSPGETIRIIGSGAVGTITSGQEAKLQPASTSNNYIDYSGISVWDNGNKIFVLGYNNNLNYKIINGIVYSTDVAKAYTNGVSIYNPLDGYLYKSTSTGGLEKVLINTSGANGDTTIPIFVGNSAVEGCSEDGTSTSNYCGKIDTALQISSGIIFFTDGTSNNKGASYSIRYFDSSNKLQTLFGSKPFAGDGKNRNLAKGNFASIYYKTAAEVLANPGVFTEGLYFMESSGFVFGRINTDETVTQLWGNQARVDYVPEENPLIVVSKDLNLGSPYSGGDGMIMTFDNEGLPWIRVGGKALKLDNSKNIKIMTTGAGDLQTAVSTTDPKNYSLYVDAGKNNFTLKGQALFVAPNYVGTNDPNLTFRLMDFTEKTTPIILGGVFTSSQNKLSSAVITTPGGVAAAALWNGCKNNNKCFLQYNSADDRLYFSENNKIRYITEPDKPTLSTLGDLFTVGSGEILNFSFSPDKKQLWYFKNSTGLYCKDFGSSKSWCDNTTNHFTDASLAFFLVRSGANQIAFKDNNTLFISTYDGEILSYNLAAIP